MNRLFALSLSVLAAACAAQAPTEPNPEPDDQTGEVAGCAPVSEAPLGADEVGPEGFSARAALDAALGSRSAPLAWADGGATTVVVEAAQAGDVVSVDYEYQSDGSGMEPAIGCVDQVEIPVTLTLSTDDGALSLSTAATLVAAADGASAWLDLPADFDLQPFVPAASSYDAVRGFVSLTWTASGVSGAIEGQGEGTDGDVAYAEAFDIATIGD
jgi:hypothetical protein